MYTYMYVCRYLRTYVHTYTDYEDTHVCENQPCQRTKIATFFQLC